MTREEIIDKVQEMESDLSILKLELSKEKENKIPEPEEGMWCYFWEAGESKFRRKLRYLREHNTDYYSEDGQGWDNCEICHDQQLPAKYNGIIKGGDLFIVQDKRQHTGAVDGFTVFRNGFLNWDNMSRFLIIHREE